MITKEGLQGNNNKGGMTIQALETILEAEDNMGRNNMNTSVQWTPPMGYEPLLLLFFSTNNALTRVMFITHKSKPKI